MDAVYGELPSDLNGLSIEYLHEHSSFSMLSSHHHSHYEIYYQITGERTYFVEDHVYHIHPGDLILVNKGDLHKTQSVGNQRFGRILISFTSDFLSDWVRCTKDTNVYHCFCHRIRQLRLDLSEQSLVESLLFRMIDEARDHPPGYLTGIRLSLMWLLLFTVRCALRRPPNDRPPVSPIHEKITAAAQYINGNYAQKISLKSIAAMNHISYYYFCRAFREITGFTLTEYINNVRVKQAKRLLWQTQKSVTDIAGEVGFESSTTFGRVFKNLTHVSPLRFRRQAGKTAGAVSDPDST